MQKKKLYITTSIPYVNGAPHIGHAVEFVQVDTLARAWKAQGLLARSQTGSDENSLKNVQAAEALGVDTEELVIKNAKAFDDLAQALGCTFDDFIRTREDRHMRGAQKLWSLCKSEDIYKKTYQGLYCVGCESFYTEKDVIDSVCPIHKKALDQVEEENYFFKLSAYQDQILALLENKTYHVYPESRRNEMISFVKQGLEDFSISRSQERAKHWGVPVPNDASQVMYVWFDALSNYITALGFADDQELYNTFWNADDVKRMHIVGKDIVRFHAIYWPAMLLSAGVPLPTDLYVHGFFTVEGEKMSKSLGNVIDPFELIQEYGADAVRYILLRELSYTDDGDLSKERMEIRYTELANQLGNLVSRVSAMSVKYFEGDILKVNLDTDEYTKKRAHALELMEIANIKGYLDCVFELIGDANELVDKKEPFKLIKVDENETKRVLSELCARIVDIATLLQPILPHASNIILEHYQERVRAVPPLFPRRDQK